MSRKTLIRYTEDGETYLGHRDAYTDGPEATDATLEELADLCDQEAESINAHDFVGVHRMVAALLHRHVGREVATAILREIAELDGLDGMNGICRGEEAEAYDELGISGPWKDWTLPVAPAGHAAGAGRETMDAPPRGAMANPPRQDRGGD